MVESLVILAMHGGRMQNLRAVYGSNSWVSCSVLNRSLLGGQARVGREL